MRHELRAYCTAESFVGDALDLEKSNFRMFPFEPATLNSDRFSITHLYSVNVSGLQVLISDFSQLWLVYCCLGIMGDWRNQ